MPSVSKATATKVQEMPPFTEHTDDLDGYTVNFVTLRVDMDLTPLLKGLPDDRCQCPHWGYQFAGTQTYYYPDRTEVVEAGSRRRVRHVHGSTSCWRVPIVPIVPIVPMTSWTSRGREMPRK